MSSFAVAVVGPDHPGIISAVSAILQGLGCNLEDVSTTVLRGHFSMMLVVAAPPGREKPDLEAALAPLVEIGMSCEAWEISAASDADEATHVLTIYGPDTTGIVAAVTRELAAMQVNVTDMVCRIHDGPPAVYVVTIEVTVPGAVSPARLRDQLVLTCEQMALDFSMAEVRPADL